jgi:Protein of unknown function (DUF3365)
MVGRTSHRRYLVTRFAVAAALAVSASIEAQAPFTSWPAAGAPAELHVAIARADLIVVSLQDSMIRELQSALSQHGAAGAIAACHLNTTFAEQRLSKNEAIAAGRTSDRLRNPTNAPRPWAAALVKAHAGERAASVDGFVVDLGDKIGVLRPIVQRPMCAGCHGSEAAMTAGVRTVLADRYPADRATGFKEGEIRGWFWVEMPKRVR